MKLSARFLTLLALAAAALTGCQQEEADYVLPSIKISGPNFIFNDETKKAACAVDMNLTTLHLALEANRDWSAVIDWDAEEVPWIAVTPETGKASDHPQRVTVTILNNAGFNRNKKVKFTIGYDYKTVYFNQTGERGEEIIGTLENPLTVAGAIKYVKSLGSDVQSSKGVYIKGKVSRIDDNNNFASSGTFGNATFYISDDGSTSTEMFYCYRVLYLGNKKWSSKTDTDVKVGDEVVIYGYVVNYKGTTAETVQGTAFIYEHNGVNRGTDEGGGNSTFEPVGTGTADDPYNVAAALAAVKPLTWSSNDNYETTDEVYVKGKISRIADNGTFGQSGTFGNATFYISDDGTGNGELYAYRILYLGNKKYTSGDDIKLGDEVVICGKLMNYRGNTPETVANSAYLYSLNGTGGGGGGGTTGGEAKGTGTLADPYNPLGAAAAVKDLTWTSNTEYQKTDDVYIKGKISRIADKGTFTEGGTYGNASFYISEDGEQKDEFYCFRILYLGNVKYTSGDDIKVGDDVVICGKVMNYKGNTPETVAGEAYLYSLNASSGGGGTTDEVKAVTIAEFNAAPESDKQVYELVGTIGGTINTTYGNFDLTDESGTVYVYGLTATNNGYGAKNDKSYESLGLNEGDKIKIRGYRGSYGDKIEVLYAWFIEKVPSGGGGGGTTDEVKAVTIAAFNAAPESDKQVYELVGTIGGTINTTYGNFDLTDESGTVYVYGLTATNNGYGAKNDKSYASLNLNEGDKIKIRGYRGSYGDKIEVLYAWFIEKVPSGGGGGGTPAGNDGTVDKPYTVAEALNAVKDLTWTSNTDYQKTEEVYMKGKISRIASKGTFTEGGTYGNASFYISDDGTENNEFYCFRVLYLGNVKYTEGQTDIQVGDEVVICGKLMNYKGNTPETVSGEAYLYALKPGSGSGSGGDGGTPSGSSVSFATNSGTQNWAADTDGTYGVGFSTTTQGLKLGFYKHTSSSTLVAPNANHVRVYKNAVLSIAAEGGKKIKKIVIGTAPNAGTSSYCFDMTGVEGGANAAANKDALTVTWTGSASKVVLQANNGQVRMETLTVEFE